MVARTGPSKYLGPFWFFGPDFLARKTQDHESKDSGAAVRVTMMMTTDDLEWPFDLILVIEKRQSAMRRRSSMFEVDLDLRKGRGDSIISIDNGNGSILDIQVCSLLPPSDRWPFDGANVLFRDEEKIMKILIRRSQMKSHKWN